MQLEKLSTPKGYLLGDTKKSQVADKDGIMSTGDRQPYFICHYVYPFTAKAEMSVTWVMFLVGSGIDNPGKYGAGAGAQILCCFLAVAQAKLRCGIFHVGSYQISFHVLLNY